MLERQLEHDRNIRTLERVHNLIVQGAKGLSVLNGGSAVAILAFVQALVNGPGYHSFKPYAVGSLSCFLLGAYLPSIAFFFQLDLLNRSHEKEHRRERRFSALWW